ncbi:MAG TPA: amidohydrolase family protein [Vicinamibacterales bacterium]|jgi:5-methylthioadenosine/S-adenosylhomocysteine deaminase|nr:amidohydrolase family protein [Vicinamibacterales bacterium]
MRIRCDVLLTNARVLTMDAAYRVHGSGAVAIAGSDILEVGDIESRYDARETIDCRGRVVMPGLINAHTHAPMTLLRGLADDLRLDVWLMGYMMPVEREFVRPDFVALGTKLACAEMIRSGTTCFADMYYFEESVAEAAAAAGLRALCAQTVLKFPSPDATSFEDALARARDFIARWKGHELIVPAVAPHAPYTCTTEILRSCAELACEFDVPLHTHLAETSFEVEQSRREHGMPVIPWVKKQRLFDARVLAAHCVHVDDGEIRTLADAGAGIAHNPTSNLKLGSGVAPAVRMLAAGAAVGIGTDGTASNNDLDMFEEMRLAALLAKGISGDPTALPARDAVAMATRTGARALHCDTITGSLELGKRADLIVVDLDRTHNVPRFGRDANAVYAQLVYAAKSSDVVDVMCNGRWVMRDRQLLTLDEGELRSAAGDIAHRVDTFLIHREQSVLQKLIAIGGATEEESFEVQVKARVESADAVLRGLASDEMTVMRSVHYHQFDTYFFFDDPDQGRLRYREDAALDERGTVTTVRARLTLTGLSHEAAFGSVLLFRSRFLAPATHSTRFYREYFKPSREREVEKDRRRWLVGFRGVQFYVHLDRLLNPPTDGYFLEVKSRTWSRRDAQDKSAIISELLERLGARTDQTIAEDYVELK